MNESYEFMRADIVKKLKDTTIWVMYTPEGEKTIEIDVQTDSYTLDFLNVVGKEGWHYAFRHNSNWDFLQRKIPKINEDC